MTHYKCILYVIFFILSFAIESISQVKQEVSVDQEKYRARHAAAAGRFYPDDPSELKEMLNRAFEGAKLSMAGGVQAIIVPHAGYVFSGSVAASGYNQVDTSVVYENIFILGSSHYADFAGASIYNRGNYETPLGEVKVNRELADRLIEKNAVFTYVPKAHITEHSIEVQLPFLQHIMTHEFQIVPIITGTRSPRVCKEIADALKPYFHSKNLFIISSDFSHYPSYNDAVKWDGKTAEAIVTASPEKFLSALNDRADDNVPQLATRACGWTSILTLLYLTQDDPSFKYECIDYKNSGDSGYGDKQRVVGYEAFVVRQKVNSGFQFTNEEKEFLLSLARSTIRTYLTDGIITEPDTSQLYPALRKHCGAFVTINKDSHLRGCIGSFGTGEPLFKVVRNMALSAAFNDRRFYPVTLDELKDIEIEISVLSPLQKIDDIAEIELGKHGIYIKKGLSSGTFLPQVSTETGWNLEEFLGHCARDKAGIGWEGWKDAEIFIYEAEVFSEKEEQL